MFRNLVHLPNIEQVFLKQARMARGSKGKAREPDSDSKTPKFPTDVIKDVAMAQRGGKWSFKGIANLFLEPQRANRHSTGEESLPT